MFANVGNDGGHFETTEFVTAQSLCKDYKGVFSSTLYAPPIALSSSLDNRRSPPFHDLKGPSLRLHPRIRYPGDR